MKEKHAIFLTKEQLEIIHFYLPNPQLKDLPNQTTKLKLKIMKALRG